MLFDLLLVTAAVSVALLCSTAGADDPYRFFTWNVTYGDIYPLGVRQQVSLGPASLVPLGLTLPSSQSDSVKAPHLFLEWAPRYNVSGHALLVLSHDAEHEMMGASDLILIVNGLIGFGSGAGHPHQRPIPGAGHSLRHQWQHHRQRLQQPGRAIPPLLVVPSPFLFKAFLRISSEISRVSAYPSRKPIHIDIITQLGSLHSKIQIQIQNVVRSSAVS